MSTNHAIAAEPVTRFQALVDAQKSQPLYQRYLAIRDWVLRLKSGGPLDENPSAYWQEELAGFAYMLDASPLILEKLRHHCFHLTGLKVYAYRSGKERDIPPFVAKMAALEEAAGGRDLFVPEAPDLGGFGFQIDGNLVNIDTLKYWESMIALSKADILSGIQEQEQCGNRPIVWEIGAGWGGFARTFKTLMPNCRYIIVDLPETMLFSSLYLGHVFPEARIYFHEPGQAPDWDADFLFFAHTDVEAMRPPRLDLVLNTVSFQEMTAEQVRGYVDAAWDRGAPALYSLNRERSLYNEELDSVSDIIEERFRSTEISVLDIPYTKLPDPRADEKAARKLEKERKLAKGSPNKPRTSKPARSAKERNAYRHIVARR